MSSPAYRSSRNSCVAVADADLLQADEHADAVVDVDDEIADLEIAQIRKKRLGRGAPALGRAALLLEDVGFGVDLQARVGQPEPARQPADRHEHRRVARVVGALDRNREDVVFLEQLDRPLGAARRSRRRTASSRPRRAAAESRPPSRRRGPASPSPAGSGRGESGRVDASDAVESSRPALRSRRGRRVVVETELRELRRLSEPRFDDRPVREQFRQRQRVLASARRASS